MARHSTITTDDQRIDDSFSTPPSLDQHKNNVFERKIAAYLSEDNGGFEAPSSAAAIPKASGTSSETDQEGVYIVLIAFYISKFSVLYSNTLRLIKKEKVINYQ